MDTVLKFHAEAPRSAASEGLAQGSYAAARAGFEPTTLWTKGDKFTNKKPRPTMYCMVLYLYIYSAPLAVLHQSEARPMVRRWRHLSNYMILRGHSHITYAKNQIFRAPCCTAYILSTPPSCVRTKLLYPPPHIQLSCLTKSRIGYLNFKFTCNL